MKNIKIFCIIFFLSLSLQNITAQKSPFSTTEKALFNDGETYFAKKNYAAASRYFEKYLTYQHRDNEESVRQAEYYIAKSAFELRKKDAKFKSCWTCEYIYLP